MHALLVEAFITGQLEQRPQYIAANAGCTRIASDSEAIASTGDIDFEAAFNLPQVLIKLSAQIGETVVVGGFQDNVLGYIYSVQGLRIIPLSVTVLPWQKPIEVPQTEKVNCHCDAQATA